MDPSSTKFLGFVLDWYYSARKVYLSMPNYILHALHRLQHSLPTRLQHAPHRHNKPVYVQKIQFAESQDDSLGFILDWDYSARKVYLSMPNYVQHALHRLQHSLPTRLQQE